MGQLWRKNGIIPYDCTKEDDEQKTCIKITGWDRADGELG